LKWSGLATIFNWGENITRKRSPALIAQERGDFLEKIGAREKRIKGWGGTSGDMDEVLRKIQVTKTDHRREAEVSRNNS